MLQLASSAIPTLNWDEALLRLALAATLGGLIGVERELREREAGLRTHLLVALGSALFTIVGLMMSVVWRRNSAIALPSARATSGSRFGPSTTSATTRITRSSGIPIPNIAGEA